MNGPTDDTLSAHKRDNLCADNPVVPQYFYAVDKAEKSMHSQCTLS